MLMLTPRCSLLAPLAALAAAVLLLTGCPSAQRTLDPAGAYAGDRMLYEFDGVIVQFTAVCRDVVALADRNAAFVAARPDLAARVAKIRAEIDGVPNANETLTRLHLTRDAYLAAKTATNSEALRVEISTARTALETARALLPLFAPSPPPPQS